jgi:ribosomal protein S27AE
MYQYTNKGYQFMEQDNYGTEGIKRIHCPKCGRFISPGKFWFTTLPGSQEVIHHEEECDGELCEWNEVLDVPDMDARATDCPKCGVQVERF